MPPPPAQVLAAFEVRASPEALSGGQATAWRAGDVVLKPLDMSIDALRWQAGVLGAAEPDGFRVAPPLRTTEGELVVDGWTAWPMLAGAHAPRWADIVAVGERFHRALAGVERPAAVLDARPDGWAQADRIAWGERPAGRFARVPEVAHLIAARTPVSAANQLIHGDLSGNVLFAEGLPPAVIDLSPYWRPPAYARSSRSTPSSGTAPTPTCCQRWPLTPSCSCARCCSGCSPRRIRQPRRMVIARRSSSSTGVLSAGAPGAAWPGQ
jgi:uncharacterized protein (TIGR02569 family)